MVTLEKYFAQIFKFFFMKKKINFDNIFTIFYIKTGIILSSCIYISFLFLESEMCLTKFILMSPTYFQHMQNKKDTVVKLG